MASFNRVILMGYVGKKPEVRAMQNGNNVATIKIATSTSWIDKETKVKKEDTQWHTVVIFDQSKIKYVQEYINKGDNIYVEGQLKYKIIKNKNNENVFITNIVLQTNSESNNIKILRSKDFAITKIENTKEGNKENLGNNIIYDNETIYDDEIPF